MQEVWLVRHGETEWSRDGRHTSRTDLPLTAAGRQSAIDIGRRLAAHRFASIVSSPRRRARDTAALAGCAAVTILDDLVEWDYGEHEGITTAEIRKQVAGWSVWTHPSPGGETLEEISARIDRALESIRSAGGDVLVFGHSHALRVLTARWIDFEAGAGQALKLDTATVSILGFDRETPVILRWNG